MKQIIILPHNGILARYFKKESRSVGNNMKRAYDVLPGERKKYLDSVYIIFSIAMNYICICVSEKIILTEKERWRLGAVAHA